MSDLDARRMAAELHEVREEVRRLALARQVARTFVPGPNGTDVPLVPAVQAGLAAGEAIPGLRDGLDEAAQQAEQAYEQASDAILAADQLGSRIEDEVLPAIDDAAASPITDSRLSAGSLTVWPFKDSTIPPGAIAPGAVGGAEIADFAIAVTKLRDKRHHLY